MTDFLIVATAIAFIFAIALALAFTGSWLIAGALNAGAGTTFTTFGMFKLVLGLRLVGSIPVYARTQAS